MDWGNKFAGDETKENARREIVLANSLAKLEVLVKHCAECERDGLPIVSMRD